VSGLFTRLARKARGAEIGAARMRVPTAFEAEAPGTEPGGWGEGGAGTAGTSSRAEARPPGPSLELGPSRSQPAEPSRSQPAEPARSQPAEPPAEPSRARPSQASAEPSRVRPAQASAEPSRQRSRRRLPEPTPSPEPSRLPSSPSPSRSPQPSRSMSMSMSTSTDDSDATRIAGEASAAQDGDLIATPARPRRTATARPESGPTRPAVDQLAATPRLEDPRIGDDDAPLLGAVARSRPPARQRPGHELRPRTRDAQDGAEVRPIVRVTIGRVDVRGTPPTAAPSPRPPPARHQPLGLEEYLRRRDQSGGSR
jgi:hypothetical protein